jgi:Cas6b C-terminal domain
MNMHPITITNIIFDIPANSVEDIITFRKPVSGIIRHWKQYFEHAGVATDYFHNHDEKTGHTINRYPLIQYHTIEDKIGITGINEGATALQLLSLLLKENDLPEGVHYKGRKKLDWKGHTVETKEHVIKLTDTLSEYVIFDWLPLEDERYALWEEMLSLQDRITLLDEALPRQISKFLNGVSIPFSVSFTAFVSNILATESKIKEYNFRKLPFTCTFRCNIALPEGIGIGQVPSIGFGRIKRIDNEK